MLRVQYTGLFLKLQNIIYTFEFNFRFTTVFPIRKVNFSCTDNDISYSTSQEAGFTFDMQIPEALIYILVFCLPIGIVSTGKRIKTNSWTWSCIILGYQIAPFLTVFYYLRLFMIQTCFYSILIMLMYHYLL